MKKKNKFGKLLVGSAALAATAAGAYYLYKNFINKDYTDDFDDFDDDFDEEFYADIANDDFDESSDNETTREYVSININDSEDTEAQSEETTNTKEIADDDEESKDEPASKDTDKKTIEGDVVAEEVDTTATKDISKDK